jgi:hypothetical protein
MRLGVLLSEGRCRRLLARKLDRLHKTALEQEQKYDVQLLFSAPRWLDIEENSGRMIIATPSGWRKVQVRSLPRVYCNQVSAPKPHDARALRDLNGAGRTLLFNETNRWNRGMLHGMLSSWLGAEAYLPDTTLHGEHGFDALRPGLYLLAPSRYNLRKRSALLHYTDHGSLSLYYPTRGGMVCWNDDRVQKELQPRLGSPARWLVSLPGWPTGPKFPVEWRLYLYRGPSGEWIIAGGVAKHDLLRSRATKERCWSLEGALQLQFGSSAGRLHDQLRAAAAEIASGLSLFLPGTAHFAVDFWIDTAGTITLIDLVGSPRLDWLRRAGQKEAYRAMTEHPIRFALWLAKTGVEKLHVDHGRTPSPGHRGPPLTRHPG